MTSTPYQPGSDNTQEQSQSFVYQVKHQAEGEQESTIIASPQSSVINARQATDRTAVYGSFGRRFIAVLIDGFIIGIGELIIMFVMGLIFWLMNLGELGMIVSYVIIGIGSLCYYIGLLVVKGATLGKMAMGLKVITVNGEPLTVGRAFLREVIGKFISAIAFYLGFLWVIWDPMKQGWHDKIAGTYVVKVS